MAKTLACALSLLSGVVGAGFASGREIVRFFAGHGRASSAAVLCAAGTMALLLLRLCAKMDRTHSASAAELCAARFGPRLGGLCSGLFFLLSAITGGAMLAACAELTALTWPIRHAYGLGMSLSLCLGLVLAWRPMRGLALTGAALTTLLPLLLIRLYALPAGEACFLPAMTPDIPVRAVSDGAIYAALNTAMLLGAAPQLLRLPARERRRSVLVFAALFGVLLALGCAVCSRHMQTAADHPMPFVALSRRLGDGCRLVALSMYAAALSTFSAMLTGMRRLLPRHSAVGFVLCAAVCLLFAGMGFGTLVQSAYPVLGAVCSGLLALLCF